ncbi:alpha/beta hydrolase [Marinimicrobium alkaliphilum]|uniref:alpha/beta hydrolase n=1 Tax=Marinimicrobium alkaliphilum TaxID=2202654 RepID=UPI000DB93819|nr:alpha/beta fold hydrolase [Marinimicrobium alkaliphilum]
MTLFSQNPGAITIDGPCGALEARLTPAANEGMLGAGWLALVCHPHPQHGGTMNNKVVTTLERCYRDLGAEVICFNFRGVGASAGTFDHAVGEVDDLCAVAEWARRQAPDAKLLLAGFSFGSSVAAQAAHRLDGVRHLTLVAPPVERYPYDRDGGFPCPVCVLQGLEDERVDVPGVQAWTDALRTPARWLPFPAAGHFFHGKLTPMKRALADALSEQLKLEERPR